ncbi:conserved oligomeric Golgi complex subunit 2-like [Penaeus monodon]|uniref:conserved oligomeric Golgi complex subunit 2-like n=1 Tax=Penaeus monodon TaxID=6687 RepID=UPI0018A766A5|nr:conserved oligomeric Golgi complex subunit 2-like [Penaeus monodon]
METTAENSLPVHLYGTSSLCFDKDDFMKNDFSVDNFVRVHQAAGSGGLETLRDDLGVYLKILRSAMIELINRDYADFVNLSTNLTGLDRLIEALKTPLGQLREEVLSVEKLLDDAITTTSQDLEKRQVLTKQKAMLHRLTQISNRLDRLEALLKSGGKEGRETLNGYGEGGEEGDLVDRLAAEVNHLNFLVSHCEGSALLDVCKPRVAKVCQFVEHGLERGLREGVLNKDLPLLRRTLRTYASLGSVAHAHQLVRELIRKSLEDVISDSALRSDPRGLPGMYANTLSSVNNVCQPLLQVTTGQGSNVVRGYSFLMRSAWPEVVTALETGTPHIFNPGNPAAFHQRYLETVEFLEAFEKLLGSKEKILEFREMLEYKNFMEHWNLPVYFQIRYQEIGQVVECSLSQNTSGLTRVTSSNGDFIFSATQTVWESLLKCYSLEIFLPPLLHRFWKLTLLILSRYRTWVVSVNDSMKTSKSSIQASRPSGYGPSPSKSQDQSNIAGDKAGDATVEKQQTHMPYDRNSAVCLIHDIQKLAQMLTLLYSRAIEPKVCFLPADKVTAIKDELSDQGVKLTSLISGLSEVIVQSLVEAATSSLRQVGDTPRLYRRTNRVPPTAHQPYIATVASVLTTFNNETIGKVDSQILIHWLTRVCTTACEQYKSLTYDVLSSVHKMEESLKRLKRARDRGAQGGAEVTGGLSDDDKIRMQICLDVEFFGSQMKSLAIDLDSVDSFVSLLTMVQNAKEGKFVP